MSTTRKSGPPIVPAKSASVRRLVSEKLQPAEQELTKSTTADTENLVSSLRQKLNHVTIHGNGSRPDTTGNAMGDPEPNQTVKPTLPVSERLVFKSKLALDSRPQMKPRPLPTKSKASPPVLSRRPNEFSSDVNYNNDEAPPPLPKRRISAKPKEINDDDDTPPPLPNRRDKNKAPSLPKVAPHPALGVTQKTTPGQKIHETPEQVRGPVINVPRRTAIRPSPPPPRSKTNSVTSSAVSLDSLAKREFNTSRNSSTSKLSSSSTPPPPPPSRFSGRSQDKVFQQNKWKQPDLDLEIPTCWFASGNSGTIPKCFQGCDWTSSYGSSGSQRFSNYAFRLPDLATAVLKFSWDSGGSSPLMTLKQSVKFIPPPSATKEQLLDGYKQYSEHIANWCEVKAGAQVGDGECWTLAHDALKKACGSHAFVSSGYNHGALILTVKANTSEDEPIIVRETVTDSIRRGDILQFTSCLFKSGGQWQVFGHPDHTAIVLDTSGSKLKIVQQNFQNQKVVGFGEIDLHELSSGELKVFRPVDSNWIIDLSSALK